MSNTLLQQRILNQLWKEGGGKPKSSNNSRGQSTGGKKPSTKSVKRKRGKGKGSNGKSRSFKGSSKSTPSQSKPSPSQNISKFGGGLKGKNSATITGAKIVAVKTGVRGLPFAKALGSSKFLAGSNSVPVLALLVGNYAVWKDNLKKIRNIYRGASPGTAFYDPLRFDEIIPEGKPPFIGGQDSVSYTVDAYCQVDYWSAGNFGGHGSFQDTLYPCLPLNRNFFLGSIKSINFELTGNCASPNRAPVDCSLGRVAMRAKIETEQGIEYKDCILYRNAPYSNTTVSLSGSAYLRDGTISNKQITITRQDGQPDTGGNPSSDKQGQYSQGGTTNNYFTTVNRIINQTVSSPKPTPSISRVVNKDKIEPVPPQIPAKVSTLDAVANQPSNISDSPPVIAKVPVPSPTKQKPKSTGKKITRYPTERELEEINEAIQRDRDKRAIEIGDIDITPIGEETIEENRQRAIDSVADQYDIPVKVVRKYADGTPVKTVQPVKVVPEIEEETETNIPPLPSVLIPKPKTKVETAAPKAPTSTNVNPCKKGCGGGAGDISPSPTTQGVNELNAALQAVDLGLLKIINDKLGNQIPNGGISSGMKNLHKSLAFDRWLNLLNTGLSLHNALMLSSSVVDTVIQVVDNVFESIGFTFKSPDGSEIGFGSVISGGVSKVLSKIVPSATLAASKNVFVKLNRFVQVGGNVLQNVRSMMDSTQDIAETTGENVSVIGNALKKGGVVRENAFPPMPERLDHNSRIHRRLEKIRDVADVFEEVTSDIQDFSEEVSEMKENSKEFSELLEKERKKKVETQAKDKKAATSNPTNSEEDEARAIPKDNN